MTAHLTCGCQCSCRCLEMYDGFCIAASELFPSTCVGREKQEKLSHKNSLRCLERFPDFVATFRLKLPFRICGWAVKGMNVAKTKVGRVTANHYRRATPVKTRPTFPFFASSLGRTRRP